MKYASVIILKKAGEFDDPLTYSIPPELESECKVGQGIYVPLRGRSVLGILVDVDTAFPEHISADKIRPIERVTDFYLNEKQIKLAKKIADYYYTSLTRSLRLMIPRAIWKGKIEQPEAVNCQLLSDHLSVDHLRGEKQKSVFEALQDGRLSETELIDRSGASKATIASLLKKKIIEKIKTPFYKKPDYEEFPLKELKHKLTDQQRAALEKVKNGNKPVLLHGITGSGKTELYLRIILEAIKKGKQAILLVPEIALTPQITDYFKDYFGPHLALFHSKLSEGKRAEEWWKVKTGYASLVIGSRSAIFAPTENLGVIILDEEHEWTYKQESAPYYQAHHVSEILHGLYDCQLIFGSATPRIETLHKAIGKSDESGVEYEYIQMNERINKKDLPKIHVVDLRDEFKQKNFSVLSRALQNRMKERLAKNEQVILFVNQRGAARAVVCRDCGYTEECPHCEVSLKLHRGFGGKGDALVCHYCSYAKSPSVKCPECKSPYIKHVGVGTQRVEEEVCSLFPSARVVRADKDTTSDKLGFEPIYKAFLKKQYDVLVGTQMVAKGLDFENVSLIGLILADIGLHIPDFRSHERLFQLITQVSGRCGRGESVGEVVLQTYQPEHQAIKDASIYNYDEFIQKEIGYREKLKYPPFHRIIKFTVVGNDLERLRKHVETEVEVLEDIFKVNKLPFRIVAAPAMIPRMADRYYYNVLIRAKNPHIIFHHWTPPKYWRVDVDPIHTA